MGSGRCPPSRAAGRARRPGCRACSAAARSRRQGRRARSGRPSMYPFRSAGAGGLGLTRALVRFLVLVLGGVLVLVLVRLLVLVREVLVLVLVFGGVLVLVLAVLRRFLRLLVLGLVLRGVLSLLVLRLLLVGPAHDLAVPDLPAPAPGLLAAHHHEATEVLEVEPGATAARAPDVAGLLEQPLGVVLDDQQH